MNSDVELVHLAQAGDAAALGALLERHRPRLYASALAILGEREAAQDAAQDACLVALLRLQELRDPAAAGGWLHAVVRNTCRMRLRSRREWPGQIISGAEAARLDVDEALDHLAMRDWLWSTLDSLPDDLRATLMLRYFTRHTTYAEIAAILGIPVGTVRSRLNQAKHRMASALLDAAAATHPDHAALVAERWHWWNAVKDEVEHTGAAALYVSDAVSAVLVEAPSIGYRTYGAEEQGQGMVETVAAGVRVHLTNIVASAGVSIAEFAFENPADDPEHCPPHQIEVRFHPGGPTTRVILYS